MYLGLSITDQSETAHFSNLLFTGIHAVPRVMVRCFSLMAAINSQQTRARKCSGVAEVAWSGTPRPPAHAIALLTLFWGPVVSRPAHAEQPANGATLLLCTVARNYAEG